MRKPRQYRCYECNQWKKGADEGRIMGADGTTSIHLLCSKMNVTVQPMCFCANGEWDKVKAREENGCPLKHN